MPKNRADFPCQIQILDYHGYSVQEIESAALVTCERANPFIASPSEKVFSDVTRIASDMYVKRCKNRTFGTFVNLFHLLAVRGEVLRALEDANLVGLQLLPLVPDSGAWPSSIEPLHLIWSSHVLPGVDCDVFVDRTLRASRCQVFHASEAESRIQNEPFYILDGFHVRPQLRYAGLDATSFDIAITRERFGGMSDHYRKIVYSRRAREVLESLDKELSYIPVINSA